MALDGFARLVKAAGRVRLMAMRAGSALVAVLAVLCVAGSAAGAAGTGWHVTPAARLGAQLDGCCAPPAAAVNRSGTSVVVFPSAHSLRMARRPVNGSRFEPAGRVSARWPFLLGLTALGNGRFLLLYATKRQLVARELGAGGRLRGRPHVLATGYNVSGNLLFPPSRSQVVVDSDASRTVAVWGVNHRATGRVEGAILGRTGWTRSKVFYRTKSPQALYRVIVASDNQDRFLVSLHGANGDTTARMWGLAGGWQQWERVTPPQAAGGSLIASSNGATVASVNGAITAAWQNASAALVVSTWNGSTWTPPVKAIAGTHGASGLPVAIYPVFVSDGSRAALVWSDFSQGFLGPVEATIRSSPGVSWSAPLVFPHSHSAYWLPNATTLDTFWFTETGALAGFWTGDGITADPSTNSAEVAGLYVGYVGAAGTSAKALSQTQNATHNNWFALARADDLHTIVWDNGNGRQFSATVTQDGTVGPSQRLHLCSWPFSGASNPDASAQLLIGGVHLRRNRLACSTALLW